MRGRAGDHFVVQLNLPDVLRRRAAPAGGICHWPTASGRSIDWSLSKAGPRCASFRAVSRRRTRSSRKSWNMRLASDIDYVMINTNGIRFARDPELVELAARHRDRLEIYLQFDGLNDEVNRSLRGEPLLETKLAALEALGRAGVHVTLVATLQAGVNDDQLGPLVEFGLARPWITGISFQPATYSGRHVLPADLERRITFPDVIRGVARQTVGLFREDDFLPLALRPSELSSVRDGLSPRRHGDAVNALHRRQCQLRLAGQRDQLHARAGPAARASIPGPAGMLRGKLCRWSDGAADRRKDSKTEKRRDGERRSTATLSLSPSLHLSVLL